MQKEKRKKNEVNEVNEGKKKKKLRIKSHNARVYRRETQYRAGEREKYRRVEKFPGKKLE